MCFNDIIIGYPEIIHTILSFKKISAALHRLAPWENKWRLVNNHE